jgi:hypothetical protein
MKPFHRIFVGVAEGDVTFLADILGLVFPFYHPDVELIVVLLASSCYFNEPPRERSAWDVEFLGVFTFRVVEEGFWSIRHLNLPRSFPKVDGDCAGDGVKKKVYRWEDEGE